MTTFRNLKAKLKNSISRLFVGYYSEIDEVILYNWEQCQKGDVRYVNKRPISRKRDFERFEMLQDQYLKKYGFGEKMETYLKLKKLLTKLRLQYVQTGNKMLLNQIEIEKVNMQSADPNRFEGLTTDQMLVHLRKWLGVWIDKKKITVVEFKELVDEYGRVNKKE